MTNITFLVVTSLLASQSPEWQDVATALAAKHADEARIVRITAAASITNSLEKIRAATPTHVAFVMRPEEVEFPSVVAIKRMMRDLNADPYDDAVWGIVTGPTSADAKRIASSREPQTISAVLATTGVDDNVIPGPFYCLSDGYPEGCWRIKDRTGKITHHSSSNDLSHVFAEGWDELDPDFILTSAHASQRNLELPFSRGNIIPRNGVFVTLPNAKLIDYKTGQAKGDKGQGNGEGRRQETGNAKSKDRRQESMRLAVPKREKIWLAAGNCLIADNLRPGDNMVMTALGFGKVNQFVGYMATTWFGEIGWTTWGNFRKGQSLVDAYFAANRQLIRELEETFPEAKDYRPVFKNARDYSRLFQEAQRFPPLARVKDKRKAIGRLWDRDATIFYGDPLQKVYLNAPVRK